MPELIAVFRLMVTPSMTMVSVSVPLMALNRICPPASCDDAVWVWVSVESVLPRKKPVSVPLVPVDRLLSLDTVLTVKFGRPLLPATDCSAAVTSV